MSSEDFERIEVRPEGVFLVRYHKLSEKAIKNMRTRLHSKLVFQRRQIADSQNRIEMARQKTQMFESGLEVLNGPELKAYFEAQNKARVEAVRRAEELLKEMIGEAYPVLQEQGFIQFQSGNSDFKINKEGRVYKRMLGEGWVELCLIRDRTLPVPDYVLAALVSVRENPKLYSRRVR